MVAWSTTTLSSRSTLVVRHQSYYFMSGAISLFEAGLPLAKPVSQQGLTFFPHAHSIFEEGIWRLYEPLLFLMHIINL